jgi:ubiquinone/menaquinone biosynthesis C-methylase UbiE
LKFRPPDWKLGLYSRHIFPRIIEWSLGGSDVDEQRRAALAAVGGSVLEVGFGTGLNLPHYPAAVTRLTVIDPEIMLPELVARRITEAAFPVEQMRLDASGRLPFGGGSFDAAVSTFTLCTIPDAVAALAEVRRVLKPGGLFVFLEHGLSDDARVAKRQNFFNPLHRFIARGCNMNRPIDRLIERAGLEIVSLDRFLLPDRPRVYAEMYRGAAVSGR